MGGLISTIKETLAPLRYPGVSEVDIIKEYAECEQRIADCPHIPPDSLIRESVRIERKWDWFGHPRHVLTNESFTYRHPLVGTDDSVMVDGVLVGGSRGMPETPDSPHYLEVETERMYVYEDGAWAHSTRPFDTESLLEQARKIALEEQLGRVRRSEFFPVSATEDGGE